jgi:peptidoglycan/LPS O-acetylase OafA/YrhL
MDSKGHIPQLDGIRAIAILAVILTHTWETPAWPHVNSFFGGAWAGVILFFVLSGYLITGVLWDTRGKDRYYFNFYGRRALRIFPIYFLVLFVVFVLWPHSAYLDPIRYRWPLYVLFMANVAVAMHGFGLRIMDITWSLGLEEQFYLAWPSVIRRLSAKQGMLTCIGIIVIEPFARLAAHGHFTPTAIKALTIFQVDSFAMGALICIATREKVLTGEQFRRLGKLLFLIAGPAILATSALNLPNYNLYNEVLFYTVAAAASSGLILSALHSQRVSAALCTRWVMHVGKVSYGTYLYHAIVIVVLSKVAEVAHLRSSPAISSVCMFAAAAIVTIAIATVSYRYFELPFLRLKRYFAPGSMGWLRTDHFARFVPDEPSSTVGRSGVK